jgi:hypothetical protein
VPVRSTDTHDEEANTDIRLGRAGSHLILMAADGLEKVSADRVRAFGGLALRSGVGKSMIRGYSSSGPLIPMTAERIRRVSTSPMSLDGTC